VYNCGAGITALMPVRRFPPLALKDDLKVTGTIDHLLITDIAELAWEIRRYRRVKTSLINSAVLQCGFGEHDPPLP
jgi:hypothetical protein